MSRSALTVVLLLVTSLGPRAVDAGDVYRTISRATDPVVAPRAPDPDMLLPPLERVAASRRPPASRPVAANGDAAWSDLVRFPTLRLPTLPSRTAFGR
jgi:hypothetical protein